VLILGKVKLYEVPVELVEEIYDLHVNGAINTIKEEYLHLIFTHLQDLHK